VLNAGDLQVLNFKSELSHWQLWNSNDSFYSDHGLKPAWSSSSFWQDHVETFRNSRELRECGMWWRQTFGLTCIATLCALFLQMLLDLMHGKVQ
jgi:hypothetical protein